MSAITVSVLRPAESITTFPRPRWTVLGRSVSGRLQVCQRNVALMNIQEIALFDRVSYRRLRGVVAALAAICPVIILLWGLGIGPLRGSLSEYYYAGYPCKLSASRDIDACYQLGHFLRDFFVGALCTIGGLLVQYRGYSRNENWALNLAGLFAACIALSPTQIAAEGSPLPGWPTALHGRIHLISLTCFVLIIAYVAAVCSETTLSSLVDRTQQRRFRTIYRLIAAEMVCMPIIIIVLSLFGASGNLHIMLVMEILYIWTFAGFWVLKSREIATIEAQVDSLSTSRGHLS